MKYSIAKFADCITSPVEGVIGDSRWQMWKCNMEIWPEHIYSSVSNVLASWVKGRFDYLNSSEYDTSHGTGVAGLITVGQATNSPSVTPEPDGCEIYDAPLYPIGQFKDQYANGFTGFLEELEQAVAEVRNDYGVRIFNLSINAILDV